MQLLGLISGQNLLRHTLLSRLWHCVKTPECFRSPNCSHLSPTGCYLSSAPQRLDTEMLCLDQPFTPVLKRTNGDKGKRCDRGGGNSGKTKKPAARSHCNYQLGVQLQPGNQEPDSPHLHTHTASYLRASGRLSSLRLQLPPTYKLTRPGELKHSSSSDPSISYNLKHTTHTPVDTQNGPGVRQHAGGTRGDHTVKWTGAFICASLLTLRAAVQAL